MEPEVTGRSATVALGEAPAGAAATAAPTRSAAAITRCFIYLTTTVKDFAAFMPDSSVTVSTPS